MDRSLVLKNISYSMISNVFVMIVSIAMVVFLPKFISVEDYGIWNMYLFYISFIGVLHFGWEDGIFLRYAGKSYTELDRKKIAGQVYALTGTQIFMAISIYGIVTVSVTQSTNKFIWFYVCMTIVISNFNNLCVFILQITNQIQKYAIRICTERIFFFLLITIFFIFNCRTYAVLVRAQVVSITFLMILLIYSIKDLLHPCFYPCMMIYKEAIENIKAGSKLMVSNLSSIAVLGIIRYGILNAWDLTIFGKVSLVISISNFFLVAINAVGIALFPLIKKMKKEQLSMLYIKIRNSLSFILLGGLMLYFPIIGILKWWLPKYADLLMYASILFPICIYESRMSLLINTYFKSLRYEKKLLTINMAALIVSAVFTLFWCFVFKSLTFMIISMMIVFAFKCILAELYIEKILNTSLKGEIIKEGIMITLFITIAWYTSLVVGIVMYLSLYVVFTFFRKKEVIGYIKWIYKR